MKLRFIAYFFMVSCGFIACNKTDNSEFTDSPIVESYLRPGDYAKVKISRQIPFSSNVTYSSDDIDALSIKITNNNITHALTPVGDGQYIDSSLIVAEGERYDLSFIYNSKSVTAYTKVPAKPVNFAQSIKSISLEKMDSTSGMPNFGSMPVPISLTWDNTDGSYYIVIIENMETTLVAIRDFGSRTPPGNRFKKAPTTSSGLEIRSQEFQYFGRHRLILYHVLPDYASLYSETESSSLNLTNPSTSIMNGYGIFTGLNSDTLFINVNQLK
ncbi:MAG: hypothetical protein ABSA76_15585 [Bacteroidales bacterium]